MSGLIWRLAVILFAYSVFVAIVLTPIILGLTKLLGVEWTLDWSGTGMAFAAIVVAPLVEELVFRAGLRSATVTLAVQPVLIALLIGNWQVALALLGVVATLMVVDHVRRRYLDDARNFSLRMARGRAFLTRYRLIVWGNAVAFGFIHIGNFTIATPNGWLGCLAVFVVSSQIIAGVVLSYFRLRYGLFAAIAFHAIFNFGGFLLDKVMP
ncbi:hypothetical protein IA69_19025 [Massilia sp. JS1662]|nr:CPBP family glutamic-type intramembrane protease [Massilia sp. JS1662]KGF80278.1 hypothetical protein IA69_19025 [Massilia sp. JS1662]